MRNWHYTFAAVAAGVTVTAALTAVGPASAQAAQAGSRSFDTDIARNAAGAEVAESVQRHAATTPGFAGLRITATGVEISVTGKVPAALVGAVRAARTGVKVQNVPVSYRRVPFSQTQLLATATDLRIKATMLRHRGIDLAAWGPDVATDTVLIHLRKFSAANARLLTDMYKSRVTVATSDTPVEPASRSNDTAPWYGGDQINRSGVYCTSWFSTYSGSSSYNLTAGHCGSGTWKVGSTTQGTSSGVSWSEGGSTDAQKYAVSSNSPVVFGDPNAVIRVVKSVTTGQVPGTLLCTDGYADTEVCDVRINQTSVSVYYNGKTIDNQVFAGQTGGHAAFTHGNSGAPVYQLVSGGVKAYGMLVATNGGSDSQGYYTPVSYITSRLGVSIQIG